MDVVLRICPIASKTSNGRNSHTDALYNHSSGTDDLGHKGVRYIRDTCGNPVVYRIHDDFVLRNAWDLFGPSPPDVSDIPCPGPVVFAILSAWRLLYARYQQMLSWL
jgi:hypothetical protein